MYSYYVYDALLKSVAEESLLISVVHTFKKKKFFFKLTYIRILINNVDSPKSVKPKN